MQHLIATYGYVAIFVLMVAESACLPVPSELIMTFGGALAAGAVPGTRLNLIGVIAAGVAGNVAGSYIAWAVGRYGGQPALRRWGHRLWLRDHDLDRASTWFDRYGPRAVLIGRVLPVVRTFISLPAGIAGIKPVRFGIYTVIGCIPWTAALAYAGYAVGANWQSVVNAFRGPTYIIAALVVTGLIAAIWWYVRRHRADRTAGDQRPDAAGRPADTPGPPVDGGGAVPRTCPHRLRSAGRYLRARIAGAPRAPVSRTADMRRLPERARPASFVGQNWSAAAAAAGTKKRVAADVIVCPMSRIRGVAGQSRP